MDILKKYKIKINYILDNSRQSAWGEQTFDYYEPGSSKYLIKRSLRYYPFRNELRFHGLLGRHEAIKVDNKQNVIHYLIKKRIDVKNRFLITEKKYV